MQRNTGSIVEFNTLCSTELGQAWLNCAPLHTLTGYHAESSDAYRHKIASCNSFFPQKGTFCLPHHLATLSDLVEGRRSISTSRWTALTRVKPIDLDLTSWSLCNALVTCTYHRSSCTLVNFLILSTQPCACKKRERKQWPIFLLIG